MADLQELFARLAELSEKERLDLTLVSKPYSIPYIADESIDDWLERLTPHNREKAQVLLPIMQALGAQEAEMWVRSEINENIPQLSRFLILRSIWKEAVHYWLKPGMLESELKSLDWLEGLEPLAGIQTTVDTLLASGVDRDVLAKFAAYVAAVAANSVVGVLDGYDDYPANAPGFVVREVDSNGEFTGRNIDGLHESFLDADVSHLT